MADKDSNGTGRQGGSGIGGIFTGLTDLIKTLGELAEKGEEFSRTSEVHGTGTEKELKGVYGFSVKVGLGDAGVKVEPFGNIHQDEKTGRSVVEEVREPLVDVFEEKDHILVVAEIPGIGTEDVQLEVKDDVLILNAEKGDKKYHKEILLPESFPREKMDISCNNGVLEIKCAK